MRENARCCLREEVKCVGLLLSRPKSSPAFVAPLLAFCDDLLGGWPYDVAIAGMISNGSVAVERISGAIFNQPLHHRIR